MINNLFCCSLGKR